MIAFNCLCVKDVRRYFVLHGKTRLGTNCKRYVTTAPRTAFTACHANVFGKCGSCNFGSGCASKRMCKRMARAALSEAPEILATLLASR